MKMAHFWGCLTILVTISMPSRKWSPKKIELLILISLSNKMVGIELICPTCFVHFFCCRKCWRGNKYCSSLCRVESRKIKQREYEKKYSSTLSGQESRRKRQRNFRLKKEFQQNVTEQTMKINLDHAIHEQKQNPNITNSCFGCGGHIRNVVLRRNDCGFQFKFIQKENSYFSFTRI